MNPARADALALFVFDRIRASNDPSAWNTTAQLARNTYVATHPGTNPASWRCPGAGVVAHDATLADVTIDHIVPVAQHWNNGGNNTSSHARAMRYQHTGNHAHLCRACNSRRGSGGIRYTIAVDPAYTN